MKKSIKAKDNTTQELKGIVAEMQIEAATAGADGKPKNPRFAMTAYTGKPMRLWGWCNPVVIDLTGLTIPNQSRPILLNHINDPEYVMGQTDTIKVENGNVIASGEIMGVSDKAKEVIELASKGFKWQASLGASAQKVEFVLEDKEVKVNGEMVKGPVNVIRTCRLGEISFVALGADDDTSADIAAGQYYDNEYSKGAIMAIKEKVDGPETVQAAALPESKPEVVKPEVVAPDMSAINASYAANMERIGAINKVCGNDHAEIAAKAIRENWTAEKAELEVLRASTPKVSGIVMQNKEATPSVLEAAAMMAGGVNADECVKSYGAPTVEAAQKQFRYGLGLQQMIMLAAWANGFATRTFREDPRGALKAAFSTSSLAGILSNVANKFLLAGFTATEQTWRKISRIRACSDFKTLTSYRLNGSFNYDEVGAGGELKHADLSEESYTNQAKTYGKIVGITRQDIINDDLGALTSVPQKLGRGAGLKFNTVFWTAFLNNLSFFTAARGNYITTVATALSLDGLTSIVGTFKKIKDAKGNYTGLDPAIMLVPSDIEGTANGLFMSELTLAIGTPTGNATAKYPATNIHRGKYEVASSRYLSDSSISGYSAIAWYLLANPQDAAAMEVLFLNGREQPTVEQADADFDTLGIQMRGYHDFGCALAEWQAGVMAKATT